MKFHLPKPVLVLFPFLLIATGYYLTCGSPGLFLDGIQQVVSPRHDDIISVDYIAWTKVHNYQTLRNLLPGAGPFTSKEGILFIVHETADVYGGYAASSQTIPPKRSTFFRYTLVCNNGPTASWGSEELDQNIIKLDDFRVIKSPFAKID